MNRGISAVVVAMLALGASWPMKSTTRLVRLQGNRFTPAETRVRAGDTVRFVNGNGGPHNVQFEADSIAPAARRLLTAAMTGEKIGPLSSPLLLDPDEAYAIVVPALPAGRFPFFCLPHRDMRGGLIVEP